MIGQRSNFGRHCRRWRRGLIARQMGWPGMRSDRMRACRSGDGPVPGRDPGRLLLGRAKCDSPGSRSAWAGILGEETVRDAAAVGSASTERVTGVDVVAATNSGGKGSVTSRRESSGAMAGITAAGASESAPSTAPSVAATAAVATTAAGVATASSASVSASATTAAASGSTTNSVGRIGNL